MNQLCIFEVYYLFQFANKSPGKSINSHRRGGLWAVHLAIDGPQLLPPSPARFKLDRWIQDQRSPVANLAQAPALCPVRSGPSDSESTAQIRPRRIGFMDFPNGLFAN